MRIEHVDCRPILDTRGRATLETTLRAGDVTGSASIPSGKSTGSHEAKELRDPDGGVSTAIANVTGEIAAALAESDFSSPEALDRFLIRLDGTPDKSRLGANAILSVSIAAQRLFAAAEGSRLWEAIARRAGFSPAPPRLFVNVLNGGVHADFRLPFQEYMLLCEGTPSAALETARGAFATLGELLPGVSLGDEGGYAPAFSSIEEPFALLAQVIERHPGVSIAIDAAATQLAHDRAYRLLGKTYGPHDLSALFQRLSTMYPIRSIEDPFTEDAEADFVRITADLGKNLLVVGDDFTVTNSARINRAIAKHAVNAVLIKPNQIGTLQETIEAVQTARAASLAIICSHRSGETDDSFIADFAYGVGAYGIKAGGLGQKERLEKYERLLEIEREAV